MFFKSSKPRSNPFESSETFSHYTRAQNYKRHQDHRTATTSVTTKAIYLNVAGVVLGCNFAAYSWLARDAYDSARARWKLRPKFHYFAHVLLRLRKNLENPRRFDLCTAEDFMGRLRKVGSQCHRVTASKNILRRHCLVLARRWYNRCKGEMSTST